MIEARQTAEFSGWLRRLQDGRAKARIAARIERMVSCLSMIFSENRFPLFGIMLSEIPVTPRASAKA
jgi:hypothetical protein